MVIEAVMHGRMDTSDSNKPIEEIDKIKMFIGQVPKNNDETDLKALLEPFGQLEDVKIIRDSSGTSKGCAFVTFINQVEAYQAQQALNGKKTLDGALNPVQIKPADGHAYTFDERKIFVGMLGKTMEVDEIRELFEPFGEIEDCVIVRDGAGNSRGCAFIQFSKRSQAISAIKNMHHAKTMPGCRNPLVVKFADTAKEKEAKKMQHKPHPSGGSMSSFSGSFGGPTNSPLLPSGYSMAPDLSQQMMMMQQQAMGSAASNVNPMMTLFSMMGQAGNSQAIIQQLLMSAIAAAPVLQANPALATLVASVITGGVAGTANIQQQLTAAMGNQYSGAAATPGPSAASSVNTSFGGDMNQQNTGSGSWTPFNASLSQPPPNTATAATGFATAPPGSNAPQYGPYGNKLEGSDGWSGGAGGASSMGSDMMNKAYAGFQQYLATFNSNKPSNDIPGAGSQTEGPDGANLFIYHLPQEFKDHDLVSMFTPFGKVISAKVFVDKVTNMSKCFGFVSYDNADSAQNAIRSMNGANVSNRRLKVALKTARDKKKPY